MDPRHPKGCVYKRGLAKDVYKWGLAARGALSARKSAIRWFSRGW